MKNLAVLLGKTEEELAQTVGKMEEFCGFPSEDIRLLSENKAKLNAKLSQLGLDPHDTTGPELYHTLLAKYQNDVAAIDRTIGITSLITPNQKITKVEQLLKHTLRLRETWAIKNTKAKEILRSLPPKKLMKALNYRSVDSLLKREDAASVVLAAEQIESSYWRHNFEGKVAKLKSTDYEVRLPKIAKLNPKLSNELPLNQALVSQAAAVVAINAGADLPALTMALLLMDGLERIGEQQEPQVISSAHTALHFWADTEHLVFDADGQPVSLNFKDVATNHLTSKKYGEHISENAHQKLWGQLMSRYKDYVDELPSELARLEQPVLPKKGPVLALEPVEIYE